MRAFDYGWYLSIISFLSFGYFASSRSRQVHSCLSCFSPSMTPHPLQDSEYLQTALTTYHCSLPCFRSEWKPPQAHGQTFRKQWLRRCNAVFDEKTCRLLNQERWVKTQTTQYLAGHLGIEPSVNTYIEGFQLEKSYKSSHEKKKNQSDIFVDSSEKAYIAHKLFHCFWRIF